LSMDPIDSGTPKPSNRSTPRGQFRIECPSGDPAKAPQCCVKTRRGSVPIGNIERNENMEFARPSSILPSAAQRNLQVGHCRVDCLKSRATLELENLALRHQLIVLSRSVRWLKLTSGDRILWTWLCAVLSDWRSALAVVKPETVIGWHCVDAALRCQQFRRCRRPFTRSAPLIRHTTTLAGALERTRRPAGFRPFWSWKVRHQPGASARVMSEKPIKLKAQFLEGLLQATLGQRYYAIF
jgi:hypothetical protein